MVLHWASSSFRLVVHHKACGWQDSATAGMGMSECRAGHRRGQSCQRLCSMLRAAFSPMQGEQLCPATISLPWGSSGNVAVHAGAQ